MSRCRALLVVCACVVLACNETGQDPVAFPLYVAGTDLSAPITTAGGDAVRIERAELAFGPLYLCAGNTAGDLCDAARLEWLGTVVVDLADAAPRRAGEIEGTTGTVRSWMYDLAISSQLTSNQAVVLPAAEELGGYSLVVEGFVLRGDREVPFRASVPILQTDDTELGVPIIRKSAGEDFTHDVTADEASLVVQFDAAAWIGTIDLRSTFEQSECQPGGSPVVCAGDLEQTCDAEGELVRARDCRELDQACLAGAGCQAMLTIDSESEAFRALRNAVTSGARPRFAWSALDE